MGTILSGPLSADGYIWLRVDFGPGLYSGWSIENGLAKICITPSAPTTTSPGTAFESGPTISTLTPTLNWTSIPNADSYALAISEYPYGPSYIIYNPQTIYDTFHDVLPSVLEPGKKYRWNMQARNECGLSPISNTLYFQTERSNAPVVTSLSVTPITAALDNPFTIAYSVTDMGGSGLRQVELWRATDSGGSPVGWAKIITTAASGQSYTGSFMDTPSVVGTYWYGIHVVDNTGEWNDEKNSRTGGSPGVYGPIKRTVVMYAECWTTGSLPNSELAELVIRHFPEGVVPQTGESIRVTAYAIARAESEGNPTACGDNNQSIGLWQINIPYHPEYNREYLFDSDYNAEAARQISSNGQNWNPWCTWERTACGGQGNERYKDWLNEAMIYVATHTPGPAPSTPSPPQNPPKCTVTVERCRSDPYVSPDLPLCWETNAVGIGESFAVVVAGSSDDDDLEAVRFLIDDLQDGSPLGQWTEWYDWNASSEGWSTQSKSVTWSLTVGGTTEVWAEVRDTAGQTSQCSANLSVVPLPELFELPDTISLDEVRIGSLMSMITDTMAVEERWPVFLNVSLEGYSTPVKIAVISSKVPITEYKLVKITTSSVDDARNLELVLMLPSTPLGCVQRHIQSMFKDWVTDFGAALAKEILTKVFISIAGAAVGIELPSLAVQFVYEYIACVADGYTTTLRSWEVGNDYIIYLPMDLPLTIYANRGLDPCMMATSPWVTCQGAPPPVRGAWEGMVSENVDEIHIDIEETDHLWFKIFSPVELRVYDSLGRVTGLVEGETREEIPDSFYDENNEVVVLRSPVDSYICEVVGSGEGTYGLLATYLEGGGTTEVKLTNVSTSAREVHQYTAKWQDFADGIGPIAIRVDSDGDGTFEEDKVVQPPVANFIYEPTVSAARQQVTFDARSSFDVDGKVVSYIWDFGDGATATGPVAIHAYAYPGQYRTTVQATDDFGACSTYSELINVVEVEERWWEDRWIVIGAAILALVVALIGIKLRLWKWLLPVLIVLAAAGYLVDRFLYNWW